MEFEGSFTSARHLSLSWARAIQSMPSLSTSWRSILILSLPFTPQSSKWSRSIRFPHQTPACTSPVPHTCHMPRPYHSWCDHPKLWKNIWRNAVLREVQLRVYLVTVDSKFYLVCGGVYGSYRGEECTRFCGETWAKETTGETQSKWEDNIKMDLQEVGCEGMDWIELAQDRDRWRALVKAVMNLRVP